MNPYIGKILADASLQLLLDKEKRNKIIAILIGIILFPIIMLAIFIEVLTHPIKYYTDIGLSKEEIASIENYQSMYGYDEETGSIYIKGYGNGELQWVVPSSDRITSPYGMRTHPIYGYQKMHTGVDIGASTAGVVGDNIVSADDGVVTRVGLSGTQSTGYGYVVEVDHGEGLSTFYAHLLPNSTVVNVGDEVVRGQEIAKMGTSGGSTGAHLHFEVRVNGKHTDPIPYFVSNTVESINPEIQQAVNRASSMYGVEDTLIYAIIKAESSFNPLAQSPVGACGLMQLMPSTAESYGVYGYDIFDIEKNVDAGTQYMKFLLDRYDNDVEIALAGYNAGIGNVDKYGGIPPFPETEQYVMKVIRYRDKFNAGEDLNR